MNCKLILRQKDGTFSHEVFPAANIEAEMTSRGFTRCGIGGVHLLPYLRWRPAFRELQGPMYDAEADGSPMVRYEDLETSRLLSD